jgi:hypothetical protein
MPERPVPNIPRQAPSASGVSERTSVPEVILGPSTLKELTPRILFTNLFLVTLAAGSLGPMQSAKADKEEFEGRKRPHFYQAGETLYCYGPGQEELSDRRFSSAIVTAETDRSFTKYLFARGLMEFFRRRDFRLRGNAQGFAVQDHTTVIRSSEKRHLHIIPQYNFQPYWVESSGGEVRYAFSLEVGTTTLPTFHIHEGLRRFAEDLDDLHLQLNQDGCKPGCPLHGRKGEVLGRFKGFAEGGAKLDCVCYEETFDPVAITVVDRKRKPCAPRRRRGGRGRSSADIIETTSHVRLRTNVLSRHRVRYMPDRGFVSLTASGRSARPTWSKASTSARTSSGPGR